MAEKQYTKVLVARYSPQNGCHAGDDTLLYLAPSNPRHVRHGKSAGFVSVADGRTRSKFGWVRSVSKSFSLDDFVSEQHILKGTDNAIRESLRELLDALVKFPDNTPIAATYVERGVEQRTVRVLFHKVFFRRPALTAEGEGIPDPGGS